MLEFNGWQKDHKGLAMQQTIIRFHALETHPLELPITWVHTLVVGSGAAGLNAALQLAQNGIEDVLIVTEGLEMGTSINAGSDKQTYYKLSLCGAEADSPRLLAESYMSSGSTHGDLALVEASVSSRAFMNLVNLGVPFPRDEYGQFVGYKTDHDPRQRATSIGPYTSRVMCERLIRRLHELKIQVREKCNLIQLITIDQDGERRIAGALVLNVDGNLEAYMCENMVFAVGGPGGLYQASVYPEVHSGAIGIALMAGVAARNLPESQYGLASIKFRWNVSGTYMQVIPRFISRQSDDASDEYEFLQHYFSSPSEMNGMVFLKGYQWPFDARKVINGSSIIDILVYIETMEKGRRVFLDYRRNPDGFHFDNLPAEALNYLVRSNACQETPIQRLKGMNPGALNLYLEHGIDLAREPLEIAVCAQHNNGGLAGNIWWESTNVHHFFPVGEVNGSHGVSRPGGAALNAGQVGSIRAAELIANRYENWTLDKSLAQNSIINAARDALTWAEKCRNAENFWQAEIQIMRQRMSQVGAQIRDRFALGKEAPAAWRQTQNIIINGVGYKDPKRLIDAFRTRHLCFAHAVYLDAILYGINSGVGSRGSAIVLDSNGQLIHPLLTETWRIEPENPIFRQKTLDTVIKPDGSAVHDWTDCRPIPEPDSWFETTWMRFCQGKIYL
jgi:succinate dehydrogenase/fumarate reductase flavoprotein subunit